MIPSPGLGGAPPVRYLLPQGLDMPSPHNVRFSDGPLFDARNDEGLCENLGYNFLEKGTLLLMP